MRTWGIFLAVSPSVQGMSSRSRGSNVYRKPPLSHSDLVDRLQARGLRVPDRERAERYLRHIGYFRLSPYAIPFQDDRIEHRFIHGTVFDDILRLYTFDRRLRLVIMDALERVEVAVRSAITDHMSMTYRDPHWYRDSQRFVDRAKHDKLLQQLCESCKGQLQRSAERPNELEWSHRSALEHYLTTYGEPELPPSWLAAEELTIGQLWHLYANLSNRTDRTAIARPLGLPDPLLNSWLRSYVRVRNICAHHGRLWNVWSRALPGPAEGPQSGVVGGPDSDRRRLSNEQVVVSGPGLAPEHLDCDLTRKFMGTQVARRPGQSPWVPGPWDGRAGRLER